MRRSGWLLVGLGVAAALGGAAWWWTGTKAPGGPPEQGSPDGLEIHRETTRMLEPRTPDDRIDYAAALNRGRAAPAAENAAIPLLAVVGTDVLVGDRDAARAALGAPEGLPAASRFGAPPASFFMWTPFEELEDDQRAELLAWIDTRRTSLDAFVEASRRPRMWAPVARDPAFGLLRSAIPSEARELAVASDALARRAEASLARNAWSEGWSDTEALLRWSALLDQQPGFISRLIATGWRRTALRGLSSALARRSPAEPVGMRMLESLRRAPDVRGLADDIDGLERFAVLDAFLEQVLPDLEPLGDRDRRRQGFVQTNAALRRINRRFDEIVALLRAPSRDGDAEVERRIDAYKSRLRELRAELESVSGEGRAFLETLTSGGAWVGTQAGDLVALVALVPVPLFADRRGRCETERRRVLVALALRLHRQRHGTYPATLDELVPGLLDAVPTDPNDDRPIAYERTEDGCTVGDGDDALTLSR